MKKIISYSTLIVLLLLSLLPATGMAAGNLPATLSIEMSKTSVNVGDTFTATFKFTDLSAKDVDGNLIPVFTYRIEGTYKNAEIIGHEKLGTTDSSYEAINDFSSGKFVIWNTINNEQLTDGAFYRITFQAKTSGTLQLAISDVQAMREAVFDSDGNSDEVGVENDDMIFNITTAQIPTVSISSSSESGSSGTGGGTGGGGTGGGGTTGSGSTGGNSGGISANPGTSGQQTATEKFIDLDNHVWAKEYIYKLNDAGIIKGISDNEFGPASQIKRGDFMLILARMLNINNEFTENFADVPAGAYYYDAIGSAKAAGIAKGSGENFMPENPITRQDLITLAYRILVERGIVEETADTAVLDQFEDKGSIAQYALEPLSVMVSKGIIQGADGNVNPINTATRAEVAVMCARIYDLVK